MKNIKKNGFFQPDLDLSIISKIHLPKSFKYYDDFNDKFITFDKIEEDLWEIFCTGDKKSIKFEKYPPNLKKLLKVVIIRILKDLNPETAVGYSYDLYKIIKLKSLINIIQSHSYELRIKWEELKFDHMNENKNQLNHSLSFIKQILLYLCEKNINSWNIRDYEIVRLQKHFYVDKYSTLKKGECFLTGEEEDIIIKYLDDSNKNCKNLLIDELIESCLIALMYQYGFRVKQLSLIRKRDVNTINTEDNKVFSVHIQVEKTKQKILKTMHYMNRKIRSDWQNIFIELINRTKTNNLVTDKFFLNTSRHQILDIIRNITIQLLGRSRGAHTFRHSAAQRMVNAGASAEELKDFLGHTNSSSCLVYFDNSPEQIIRINDALAISDIYSKTSKIAHGEIISIENLNNLPSSKQIVGYPHGTEIFGIGGCDLTQSLCPLNPVISCYGCNKFLPVNNINLHQKVEETLRVIVHKFYQEGSFDPYSPTYLQLKKVLKKIQSIISELKENHHE